MATTTLRLPELLEERAIGPDDPGYDEARAVFSPRIDRRPAAIVRPRNAAEVAAVVALARDSGLELAVRSGGHSQAGHSVSDGGLVLDLSRLKVLELDPDGSAAWAETGLTAGEVTAALAPDGLAVGFGDTGVVGIGGLTLGGGIGYLVRRFGLTIDSLLAAELVTADGRLVRVDAEHHPDLFWAIRGGGGNFGVATRLRFRLQPVGAVTGGMLVLPATPDTVASFVAEAGAAPDELSTIASVMTAPPLPFLPAEHHGRPIVLATLVHAGPLDEAEHVLAPFRGLAAPLADMIRPLQYAELFPPADGAQGPLAAGRTLFLDRVDGDSAAAILERLEASTAQIAAVQLRVLGGAVARIDPDATAFAHRGRQVLANVGAVFTTPEEAPVHEAWAAETHAALRQGGDAAYVNFLGDEGAERVHAAYPGETWERLVAVKRRYDPDNLFRLNQNVTPSS